MIHEGSFSEHPYNTCSIAGVTQGYHFGGPNDEFFVKL